MCEETLDIEFAIWTNELKAVLSGTQGMRRNFDKTPRFLLNFLTLHVSIVQLMRPQANFIGSSFDFNFDHTTWSDATLHIIVLIYSW